MKHKFLLTLSLLLLTLTAVSCKGDEHVHQYIDEVIPPTCVAEGFTLHTCLDCDHFYKDTPTPTVAHSYEETTVAPTCTDKGYTAHTCTVCGHTYNDTPTDTVPHLIVDKVTPPTCDEKGYTSHTCIFCGNETRDAETPATGHAYSVEVIPPTGTQQGYTKYTCYDCDNTYNDNYTDPIKRTVMATFRVNGGTMPEDRTIYLYQSGEQATLPVPTMEGHVFEGWYIEQEGEQIFVQNGIWNYTYDIDLTAAWSPIKAQVTLVGGPGCQSLPWDSFTAFWGRAITGLPTPVPTFGYLFEGWYDGDTLITAQTVSSYTEPLTLTARFRAPLESGTLTTTDGKAVPWAIDAEGLLTFTAPTEGKGELAIPARAFADRTVLRTVRIPSGLTITDIGGGAFAGCTGLTSFTVPGTATVIRSYVFEGCTSLSEVTLGSGISVINEDAFKGCSSLTTLTLPLSLYQIYGPFDGCTSLSTIVYEGNEFQWSVIVKDAKATQALSAPGVKYTYQNAGQ